MKKKISLEKTEHITWVMVYKHLGPPAKLLYDKEVCEEVANPIRFADRGSGTMQRRLQKLGRLHAREQQAKRRQLAGLNARVSGSSTDSNMLALIGVEQTVQLAMDSQLRMMQFRKNMIETSLKYVTDEDHRQKLIQQLINLCGGAHQDRQSLRTEIFGSAAPLPATVSTPASSVVSQEMNDTPINFFSDDTGDDICDTPGSTSAAPPPQEVPASSAAIPASSAAIPPHACAWKEKCLKGEDASLQPKMCHICKQSSASPKLVHHWCSIQLVGESKDGDAVFCPEHADQCIPPSAPLNSADYAPVPPAPATSAPATSGAKKKNKKKKRKTPAHAALAGAAKRKAPLAPTRQSSRKTAGKKVCIFDNMFVFLIILFDVLFASYQVGHTMLIEGAEAASNDG